MLLVFNDFLAHLYVKIIFISLPFLSMSVSCFVFLFAVITNVGLSRCGDSWWSWGWWRCSCL